MSSLSLIDRTSLLFINWRGSDVRRPGFNALGAIDSPALAADLTARIAAATSA
jgi:hypothetical protein